MIYRVEQIMEDDFGCEERREGQKTMVLLRLSDEQGKVWMRREEDDYLYEQDIQEGDSVVVSEEHVVKAERDAQRGTCRMTDAKTERQRRESVSEK